MAADDELVDEQNELWISLQEASALLGVTPSTIRRWGDTGRVPVKRTLGGHRRFEREAIVKLAHGQKPTQLQSAPQTLLTRPQAAPWGIDPNEMARQQWHSNLVRHAGAAHLRGVGQRLLGLLMQYINRREQDQRFLDEARSLSMTYGREAQHAGVSLHDTVEAFLFFRRAFAQMSYPPPGIAQPYDLVETAALQQRIDQFMDAILLGTITGYEEYLQAE
jgi:excisionase family DNA binding protein